MKAYVLVDCSPEDAERIAGGLRQQSGVLMADEVNGPYPVIAVVEGDGLNDLADAILFRIRKTEGVNDITVYLTEQGRAQGRPARRRLGARV